MIRLGTASAFCCALLGGAGAAGGAPGTGLRRQLNQVERLLVEEQVEAADRLLAAAARAAPDHARVLQLQAELRFLRGDYAEGTRLAREAVRRNRSSLRAKALRNLIAATAEAVKGYVEHRSASGKFRIFTSPGRDQILVPFAGETLDRVQALLKESLGYAPGDAVRVEIYPSPETLSQVSPLTLDEIQRSGTIALSKYNRLMIVTPRALLRGYAWLDTLAHEYVHLVVSRVSLNQTPIWLHEGLAKFFEAAWRLPPGVAPPLTPAQEHLLAEALRANQLLRWEQMHPSMAKLPDQRSAALAFAQVQTAIGYVARQAGETGLRRLLDALARGQGDWAAIKATTGHDRALFDQAWRKHLRSLNLRRLGGLVPPEIRFGKRPTKEQRYAALKEGSARRFMQIADLLRTRGHTRAAIVEYQKARGLLGARDDLVANHLARAYLELGSPEQARSTLLPVLEYYPDLPGPQVTMGAAHLKGGDLAAAERHFKVALRLNPFDPEIHCGLAVALRAQPAPAARHQALCATLRAAP
jgi:tetratricopeptide (TPR) repeat protein